MASSFLQRHTILKEDIAVRVIAGIAPGRKRSNLIKN
jgi:hypothetical protein